jgi:ketosteroid isomerase-like protein
MSQENAERFARLTESFNRLASATAEASDRGDALRAWVGSMDPEVQFEPQQAALQGTYVGRDGVTQWIADLVEHYEIGGNIRFSDVRDLDDRVLAIGTLHFTGRGSGIETEAPVAILATFRDGLITHFKDYGDNDKALQAAGLSE